ncbi:hypothetical protein E4U92_28350 [Streptomyces galbus]|uniref:Uncharacterized protein n=1 Tax=Streptomyces galbus TaxID=33898 RepID=A0A4V6AX34_STRGB|nr:hypothetical protein E4U92_28350 [Streptomyces galbus]
MARDHGFGCVHQMQGQMHVHVTEIDLPVPLLGHFFRHLLADRRPEVVRSCLFPCAPPCVCFGFFPSL